MHLDKNISPWNSPGCAVYMHCNEGQHISTLCKLYRPIGLRMKLDASECVYSLSRNSIKQFQASARGFISLKYRKICRWVSYYYIGLYTNTSIALLLLWVILFIGGGYQSIRPLSASLSAHQKVNTKQTMAPAAACMDADAISRGIDLVICISNSTASAAAVCITTKSVQSSMLHAVALALIYK